MAVSYHTIPPPAHLSSYVRCFWVLEYENTEGVPYIYRSMADGCVEMVFHYSGAFSEIISTQKIFQGNALLHSQSGQYRRFETPGSFGIFGVYLYPYTIKSLLNIPVSEFTGAMPALDILWGKKAHILEEQIMLAGSSSERVHIMTQFLEILLFQDIHTETPVEKVIRYLIHTPHIPSVQELAARVFLSTRQMERKFKEYSGFSPKLYTRILRFQQAIQHYGKMQQKKLSDIALECGYYDQSHFIHEFRQFSGYHPGTFFHGITEGMEVRSN